MGVVNFHVAPRKVQEHYNRTKIQIVFDPVKRRWRWKVIYEVTLTFEGVELTVQSARVAARKKIDDIKSNGAFNADK